MRAGGQRHRPLRALLDEQDGEPAVADPGQRLEDDVDDLGRQAERRLVEQQHLGLGDEGPRDRELLLLATGKRPGGALPGLVHDREEVVGGLEAAPPPRARRAGEAEPKVLLDGQLGEDPPPLRDERDPGAGDVLRPRGRAARRRRAARSRPRAGRAP